MRTVRIILIILALILILCSCSKTSTISTPISVTTSTFSKLKYPPPWINVPEYTDFNKTVVINVGNEFTVGLNTSNRLGYYWDENHDKSKISLLDFKLVTTPSDLTGVTWFLFKAIQQTKSTQINFYYHLAGVKIAGQELFNITIDP